MQPDASTQRAEDGRSRACAYPRPDAPQRLLLLHGPNLNMLGSRDPEHYGTITLPELEAQVGERANGRGFEVACLQSNHEGVLIDALQAARAEYAGIVFNPGAYAHYSIALRDAIECAGVPVVEVHLSDIAHREEFRRVSVTAPVCIACIHGRGVRGYFEAVDLLAQHLGV